MSISDLAYTPRSVISRPTDRRLGNPKPQNVTKARDAALAPVAKPESRFMKAQAYAVPGSTPVPLEKRTGCAWPVTERSPHLFCNEAIPDGHKLPYCADHLNRYHNKGQDDAE